MEKPRKVQFTLRDTEFPLKKYNILVNGVPVYGAAGEDVVGNEKTVTKTIELSKGANRVEVTCFNEAGAESLRDAASVDCGQSNPASLYFYRIRRVEVQGWLA